jgi:phosphoglycolate phosphatase
MTLRYEFVVFDLDGTLVDSQSSALRGLISVLNDLGVRVPGAEELNGVFGRPLIETMRMLVGTDEAVVGIALQMAQQRWDETVLDLEPYSGVREMLERLSARGCRMSIATGRYQGGVDLIVEHLGWTGLFDVVAGSQEDGSGALKSEVITAVLDRAAPADRVVMVGDHPQDINGAKAVGIDSIAVTYGYGTLRELTESGPTLFAESLASLEDLLTSN